MFELVVLANIMVEKEGQRAAGLAAAAALAAAASYALYRVYTRQQLLPSSWSNSRQQQQLPPAVDSVLGAIGNTPLIRIASLSEQTGCEILGKAEFLNPGGSVKDRVALRIVEETLASGQLQPGGLITEGTAGSTGVSLAMVGGGLLLPWVATAS